MPIFCSRTSEMSSVERQNHRKQHGLVPGRAKTLVKNMVWRRTVAESTRGVTKSRFGAKQCQNPCKKTWFGATQWQNLREGSPNSAKIEKYMG